MIVNYTDKSEIVNFDETTVSNKINSLIEQYKVDNDIDNINKLTQLEFSALLDYIADSYIKPLNLLKLKDNDGSQYDMNKCCILLDIYIKLCKKYNKVVDDLGYLSISGIKYSTFEEWREGKNILRSKNYDLIKTLYSFNEKTLTDKLLSKDVNPVGVIAILNHTHNWAQQEQIKTRQVEEMDLDTIASRIGIALPDSSN